ncbi:hypothetical protein E2C01_094204 [Portunus trituberculatus]|uniref:Uncharacterized protein n=1 Tax=Portunus trituberculatus TaxID=210409 RepID=A0A5B7JL90_PORTR|nr:hypothetical protein [Portunus trituberculatus]
MSRAEANTNSPKRERIKRKKQQQGRKDHVEVCALIPVFLVSRARNLLYSHLMNSR